jgi:methionyl-tRNA formyltransferase
VSDARIERVALLQGRPDLWWFQADALARLEAETDASVDLVVRTDLPEGRTPPADATRFDAPVVPADLVAVDDTRVAFPDHALARIGECDLAVHVGVGVLAGDVLSAPTHGVLSYHHGDLRRYRGVITHFWNYLDRVETGGVTVQRLTPDLDAGEIVAETSVRLDDAVTWSEVESRKHRAGVPLLAEAVRNVGDPDTQPTVLDESELGRMYGSGDITPAVLARYVATETRRTLATRYRKLRYLLGLVIG